MSQDPSAPDWQSQADVREHTVAAPHPTAGTPVRDAEPAGSSAVDAGPVYARRVDGAGALLLLLAGAAAAGAMLLRWLLDDPRTGFELVQDRNWNAIAVLAGGGLVLLMGIALLIPMRHHRAVGLLALLGALAVSAAVVRLVVKPAFTIDLVGPGFGAAMECAALGLLGALKAVLTPGRKVS